MVQCWVVGIEGQIRQFLSSRSSTVQGAQMEDSKERVKRKLLRDLCQLTDFDAWLPATGLVFWVCYAWVENASKLGFSSPNNRVSWWATNWSIVLCGNFVIGGGRGNRQRRAGHGTVGCPDLLQSLIGLVFPGVEWLGDIEGTKD